MNKVIAILGAGTGLAASVARRYGKQGYTVALVARNPVKLKTLADGIATQGVHVETFSADLSAAANVSAVMQAIQDRLGRIDVLYYAPNPVDPFLPATTLTPEALQPRVDLFFFGLLTAVNAVLPGMKARGGGRILSGFGGSAQIGFPHMSGSGPAMAAARNYLQSLQKEVLADGIEVGVVTITAIVRHSAFHQGLQTGDSASAGVTIELPEADPDQLAELLDEACADPLRLEASYPAA